MSLSFYLYFKGRCEEAFDHYINVFSAEEICRQRYSEAPPDILPNQDPDLIMHTTIKIGETILMGSDRGSSCEETIQPGNNFAISYRPRDRVEADRVIDELASGGGQVTLPLHNTFWGSYFGLCTDRFGINWMINLPSVSNES